MTIPLKPFFNASVTASARLTDKDRFAFLQLQAVADLKGTPYLKSKTLHDLQNDIHYVSVKNGWGQAVGHCFLTDATHEKAAYAAAYPDAGKTLILTTLFIDAGHNNAKGTIPAGMGPASTLFSAVYNFALQNGYDAIVAKSNVDNTCAWETFVEKWNFTPSSPFQSDNEDYTSHLYVLGIQ